MSDDGTAGTTATQATGAQGTGTPAGWYADPQGAMRWWDGTAWTTHVAPGAAAVTRTATILSTSAPAAGAGAATATTSRMPKMPALGGLPPLSRRTWLVVGAVGAVLVLLAGYLLFGRGGDEPAAGPVVHHATPQEIVKQVALGTHDLKNGLRVSVTPDSVLASRPDDMICGRADPTDAHRVARRDVTVVTATGQQTGLENEVDAYDSPASAHAEMVGVRATLTHCARGYVRLNPRTKDLVQFSNIRVAPVGGSRLPSGAYDEELILTLTVTMQKPRVSAHDMVVMVRRGSVITTMALVSPVAITPTMDEVVGALSLITVRRLPAS
jgi:hypothetical protein